MKAIILKGTSPIECDFCVKGYENCESIRAWIGCPTSGNLPQPDAVRGEPFGSTQDRLVEP